MSSNANTNPLKTVRCPGCGGPSIYAPSNAFRPFCCERCKNMDFGAWAMETFKLPEQDSQNDPDFRAS
ncbi:MAG: DNA gyrase inhibitor YacG [Pseudomonadota bacterium]